MFSLNSKVTLKSQCMTTMYSMNSKNVKSYPKLSHAKIKAYKK